MAILPRNLDYTDKDFASIRARLFDLLPQVMPDWTDRETANFGNILIELFAWVADVLCYYQDNQAKESRLSDAVLRKSVLALVKQLAYVPEGNAAASADVLVTLSAVPTTDVVLPAGQIYETAEVADRLQFQQLFDVTIPAGISPPQVFVSVEHSSNYDETFTSTGLPNQEFRLSGTPFLDASLVVTALNGAYAQVTNFLNSTANDRHFTLLVDDNGRALVRFGNGVNGEIPSGVITSFYKTGGGSSGNVDENTITRVRGTLTDATGTRVSATATNPEAASGGFDRESIASIKLKAPPSTKVTDRTVGYDDYIVRAENVPGVARALMVTADEVPGIPENRGYLYIVPDGSGIPSTTLKATVLETLTITYPNTITFRVFVVDPTYLPVNVAATVYFEPGSNPRAVVTSISTALTEYFQTTNADGTPNPLVKFGIQYGDDAALPMSDLFCTVEDVTGVRKIGANDLSFLLNLVHGDLTLQYYEFPVLGTVTITDGQTGLVVEPL